jgi:hypothetical protein
MKKNTPKKLTNKLARYGAMSLAIAGVSNAMGQVVYTDVDPDETVDDGIFEVDFNDDGIVDFEITNNGAAGNAVRMYNDNSNSVMGVNFGGNYNYPSVLNSGSLIGDVANFTAHPVYQTLNWDGCAYTNSQWCDGQVDKFVGVRFNVGSDQHYGWIQLDVPADASTFTIKGFAFESTPDADILAGDQGTLGLGDANFNDFNYALDSRNNLILTSNTAMERLTLVNVLGQQVMDRALSSNSESVDLNNLNSGLYIARVSIEGTAKTFKIVVR